MSGTSRHLFIVSIVASLVAPPVVNGGDWPLWRYDAQRSAASPDELPAQLRLHWVRQLPRLKPAWPDQPKMQFDAAYEPIVMGQRLFMGSSLDGSVTAYDTRTGAEVWRFFADGPVRFAPLAWRDKLYFVADDGYLYCLRAQDGSLVWRFRGGPSDRKILGNERLISTWPARGAPVIADGKIYFAAGIWPFMGIFLHALDATTGQVLWTNDGDGSLYIKQPHNTDSFAGVAPQGPLVVIGERLLVPGGRSVPACYDRATGQMIYFQLAENGKRGGGSTVAAVDQLLFNGGAAFDLATEKYLGAMGELFTFAEGRLYDFQKESLRSLDLSTSGFNLVDTIDLKGVTSKVAKWSIHELNFAETPRLTALIKAGSRLFAGSEGHLIALALPMPEKDKANVDWESTLEGLPVSLLAADDKLFAVTREGRVYCFGDAESAPALPPQHEFATQPIAVDERWADKARLILKEAQTDHGYCLVSGIGTGGLVRELARQSSLRLVVIEPDARKANDFREQLRILGLHGDRIAVLVADPREVALPPYFASLIVAESVPPLAEAAQTRFVQNTFAALRPYGGVACLPIPVDEQLAFAGLVEKSQLAGAAWRSVGELTFLAREGALPDSANWTHEHADAANTRVSKDKVAKAPLGLLWFGGSF